MRNKCRAEQSNSSHLLTLAFIIFLAFHNFFIIQNYALPIAHAIRFFNFCRKQKHYIRVVNTWIDTHILVTIFYTKYIFTKLSSVGKVILIGQTHWLYLRDTQVICLSN